MKKIGKVDLPQEAFFVSRFSTMIVMILMAALGYTQKQIARILLFSWVQARRPTSLMFRRVLLIDATAWTIHYTIIWSCQVKYPLALALLQIVVLVVVGFFDEPTE